MTAEQFSNALSVLESRVADLPGTAARELFGRIAGYRDQSARVSDDPLSYMQHQLTLLELQHEVSLLESARPYVVTTTALNGRRGAIGSA